MNYAIFECDGVVKTNNKFSVYKRVPYVISENEFYLLRSGEECVYYNLQASKNITTFKSNGNYYHYIRAPRKYFYSYQFESLGLNVCVEKVDNIVISVDNKIIYETSCDLVFLKHETFKDVCLLFFKGDQEFLVAFDKTELLFAGILDEVKETESERYYLTKLRDSLNHGKVLHIGETCENYLVYLDDLDLCLRDEFAPQVFLDCVKCGNFKYANNLLSADLKQQNVENIGKFFLSFDDYLDLGNLYFALIKKNTLVGVFSFEIDSLITNIIEIDIK